MKVVPVVQGRKLRWGVHWQEQVMSVMWGKWYLKLEEQLNGNFAESWNWVVGGGGQT